MAKPIFTIGLPITLSSIEMMELKKSISGKFKDYHILVYFSNELEAQFKAFYEKDFNEVKFEELKQIIKDLINEKS